MCLQCLQCFVYIIDILYHMFFDLSRLFQKVTKWLQVFGADKQVQQVQQVQQTTKSIEI